MQSNTRRTISMARRALDFATTHALTDAGYTTVVARLKDEVTKADDLGRLQAEGIRREHVAHGTRYEMRRTIRSQQLRRLSKLASLAGVDHPELVGKYDLPPREGPYRSFLLRAQSMLSSATEQKDLLGQLGLGDSFIADLTNSLATYEGLTANAHAARVDHVGASGALRALARRCEQEVDVIGTYIASTYANDAQTLTAWQSARNVAGPFTHAKNAAPEPAPIAGTGAGSGASAESRADRLAGRRGERVVR